MKTPQAFKSLLHKFSSASSLQKRNNDRTELRHASSSLSQIPQAETFRLPKDLSLVAKHRHDHALSQLPIETHTREQVQYFIYMVLTTKAFRLTGTCPQWVLETCWAWKGNGHQFLAMDDRALSDICPLSPGAAPIDASKYKVESFPPSEVREMIGKALISVVRKQRHTLVAQKEKMQRDWDAERHRTLPHVDSAASFDTQHIRASNLCQINTSSFSTMQTRSTMKTSPPPSRSASPMKPNPSAIALLRPWSVLSPHRSISQMTTQSISSVQMESHGIVVNSNKNLPNPAFGSTTTGSRTRYRATSHRSLSCDHGAPIPITNRVLEDGLEKPVLGQFNALDSVPSQCHPEDMECEVWCRNAAYHHTLPPSNLIQMSERSCAQRRIDSTSTLPYTFMPIDQLLHSKSHPAGLRWAEQPPSRIASAWHQNSQYIDVLMARHSPAPQSMHRKTERSHEGSLPATLTQPEYGITSHPQRLRTSRLSTPINRVSLNSPTSSEFGAVLRRLERVRER
jgi:hypothetical protein